ncbi:16S rRNA (guanine(527)-N(7))-methyltransferase RsmG [Cupriavidus oxalaticus]|jgi:16S rRNA (guanine527-N7)-methyltransferase|uniref:Ribosomal RNA small subunit methyltransferase G n=1 Tax=Cupriavidus oxalaticus TaxID=96344 RepID=A0A976B8R0_9BURK|nr:16S rRNA (guanine(527)-N(7))-methyltransferase RsmG [Cupriavidus oxalaticus]QRQ87471.1 16S rRNA (guanine(527)-N(7))-methyltransferase RsmG [Cupriavidus oxalaticus]QRQ94201.1 16S rRNA (guanine(527)-N(7))-methyltransferase RsmG [Cupriavidus oxalaticus]WQD82838.1 16S rRNA (guanine(527)-N(7))-methyltransferase RsmG [Cupriavidus oxalaticus]SPC10750.1 Ribosomal RNA small subunit methyltransferase G [Cupriavidus oxalaticus]
MTDDATQRRRLEAGLAEIGLALAPAQIDKLFDYLALLRKWNGVYNLTAIRHPDEMLTHHMLDSLAAVPALAAAARSAEVGTPARGSVLDVGSGGGMPGLPLAIACPDVSVLMVDIVQKKTAFLTQCRAQLGLANAAAHWGPVEKLEDTDGFAVITSRAFAELADFVNLSGQLLAPHGKLIAMKGVYPQAELDRMEAAGLMTQWQVDDVPRLTVPGLDAERHLVVLSRRAGAHA